MEQNVKGILISRLINEGFGSPAFEYQQHGPIHAATFVVRVRVGDQVIGKGTSRTKKEAERIASAQALEADWRQLLNINSKGAHNTPRNEARYSNRDGYDDNDIGETESMIDDSRADDDSDTEEFLGEAWPVYSEVLAQAVNMAVELSDDKDGPDEVRQIAAKFYKDLLGDLGHQPIPARYLQPEE